MKTILVFSLLIPGLSFAQDGAALARGVLRSDGSCSFTSNLNQEDQTLLISAQSVLSQLQDTDACRDIRIGNQTPAEAYDSAVDAYRNLAGLNTDGSATPGRPTVRCNNYVRIYDEQYERFIADWRPASSGVRPRAEGSGVDAQCARSTTYREAVSCATVAVAHLKRTQSYQCQDQAEELGRRTSAQMEILAVQSGMVAIRQVLERGCVSTTGGAAGNLGQAGIQLAGQAATMATSYGSIANVLIGGATDLLSGIVRSMFSRDASYAQQMQDYDDLRGLACMYEQVESRNSRCNGKIAAAEIDASNQAFRIMANTSQQCLDQGGLNEYQGITAFLGGLQPVADRLASVPAEANRPMNLQEFDQIMTTLGRPMPGMGGLSGLDFTIRASSDVAARLRSAGTNGTILAELARERNQELTSASGRALFRQSLTEELARVTAVSDILRTMRRMNTDNEMDDIDDNLEELNAKITSANLSEGRFNNTLQDIMRIRQNPALYSSDTLSTQIRTYQTRLGLAEAFRSNLRDYERTLNESNESLQDEGMFNLAQEGLRRFINRRLEDEMSGRARDINEAFEGLTTGPTTSQSTLVDRQSLFDQHLRPLLKLCNQLRTVMTGFNGTVQPNSLHEQCARFVCADGQGIQHFQGLERNGECSGDCMGRYRLFVCTQTLSLRSIEDVLGGEFKNNGTICGRPVSSR